MHFLYFFCVHFILFLFLFHCYVPRFTVHPLPVYLVILPHFSFGELFSSCIVKYLVLSLTLTLALLFALLHIYSVLVLELVYILVECMLFWSSPVFYASFSLKTYLLNNFRLQTVLVTALFNGELIQRK